MIQARCRGETYVESIGFVVPYHLGAPLIATDFLYKNTFGSSVALVAMQHLVWQQIWTLEGRMPSDGEYIPTILLKILWKSVPYVSMQYAFVSLNYDITAGVS